jgi:hypothetical protein
LLYLVNNSEAHNISTSRVLASIRPRGMPLTY